MSHILSAIIKKKFPLWNQRIYKFEDMPELCREARTSFIEAPIRHKGEYTMHGGYPMIIVRKGLKYQWRLWVAMHELGHHLLHYPTAHRFSRSIYTKADREANFFAAVAMMPTLLCRQMTPDEIHEHYGYDPAIIEIRREITEQFRI